VAFELVVAEPPGWLLFVAAAPEDGEPCAIQRPVGEAATRGGSGEPPPLRAVGAPGSHVIACGRDTSMLSAVRSAVIDIGDERLLPAGWGEPWPLACINDAGAATAVAAAATAAILGTNCSILGGGDGRRSASAPARLASHKTGGGSTA
jgi:hypothetical protein